MKLNPKTLINEPIKQANTIAFIALGLAVLALGIAISTGVKQHAH